MREIVDSYDEFLNTKTYKILSGEESDELVKEIVSSDFASEVIEFERKAELSGYLVEVASTNAYDMREAMMAIQIDLLRYGGTKLLLFVAGRVTMSFCETIIDIIAKKGLHVSFGAGYTKDINNISFVWISAHG